MFELYLNVWWNFYCNSVKLFTPNGVNVITIKMQLGFNPWNTSQRDYYSGGFFLFLLLQQQPEKMREKSPL